MLDLREEGLHVPADECGCGLRHPLDKFGKLLIVDSPKRHRHILQSLKVRRFRRHIDGFRLPSLSDHAIGKLA